MERKASKCGMSNNRHFQNRYYNSKYIMENVVMWDIKSKIIRVMRQYRIGNEVLKYRLKKKNYKLMINDYSRGLLGGIPFFIYGYDDYARTINKKLIREIGRGCDGFIVTDSLESNNSMNEAGKSIHLISLEDLLVLDVIENVKIVVPSNKTIINDIEKLLDYGIKWDQIVLGHGWQNNLGGKGFDAFDMMLGYTREDDLPGFTVFEPKVSDGNTPLTIVVLGNSTTDPYISNIKSWPEYMYRQLQDMGISVKMVIGALRAYHSRQEVLKLLRDVLPMNPDIVISYSGINDTEYFQRRNVCLQHPDYMIYQREFMDYSMRNALKHSFLEAQHIMMV